MPDGNPFVGDPDVLPEIWAVGLRHPQFLSWDQGGRGQMLVADIGEANLEEVNVGSAGANYGWREREGTFAFEPGADGGLFELPAFDASFDFTYPVAQYDHDDGAAIAGGFVYRGSQVRSWSASMFSATSSTAASFTSTSPTSSSAGRRRSTS